MRLIYVLALIFSCSVAQAANVETTGKVIKVATISPIAYSITEAITAGTDIETVYIPPTRLPINRIPSWLSKNRNLQYGSYDALVQISSVRPELDFYHSLRKENIRLVPIDIAIAMIPGGEEVATQTGEEYFWLNINNALMMLGIAKRDLSLLWPEHAEQMAKNHDAISKQLREISLQLDNALLNAEFIGFSTMTDAVTPLLHSLMLPVFPAEDADETMLTVGTRAKDSQWVIDDFSRHSEVPFIERWQQNLAGLIALTQ